MDQSHMLRLFLELLRSGKLRDFQMPLHPQPHQRQPRITDILFAPQQEQRDFYY